MAAAAALPDTLSAITNSLAQANTALSPLLANVRSDTDGSLALAAAGAEGLSLLALRPNLLLAYAHAYTLLLAGALHPSSADVAASEGSSVEDQPSSSVLDDFTAPRPTRQRPRSALRSERALVEEVVLVREVMDRVKGMEAKVQKQVDRLVKGAVESDPKDLANDPMSFRPNPSALVKPSGQAASDDDDDDGRPEASTSASNALYRPPRLAAVPYSDLPKSGRAKGKQQQADRESAKTSSLLKDYALGTISALPHQESVSGLPSLSSSARSKGKKSLAQEQDEYEESSFVRLPLKKTELKRREREERDDAFGIGGGSITGWDDVLGGLAGVGGYGSGSAPAGSGERGSAWERRKRGAGAGDRAAPAAKKGRFERDVGKQARRGGKRPAKQRCKHRTLVLDLTASGGSAAAPSDTTSQSVQCPNPAVRLIGTCPHCSLAFCSTHRLPEEHRCPGLQQCRDAAFEANKARLEAERTTTRKLERA